MSWIKKLVSDELPDDLPTQRKARLMVIAFGASAILLFLFGAFYLLIEYYLGAIACAYGIFIAVLLLVIFRITGNFFFCGRFFDYNALLLFAALIYGTGGIFSPIIPWLAIIPASGFVFEGRKRGLIMSALSLILVITFWVLNRYEVPEEILYNTDYAEWLALLVNGGLLGYILMVLLFYEISKERTIGELATLNQQVMDSNVKLEDIVRERTLHLEQAKEELDTFLYESAHALRRPLARVLGLTDLIKMAETEEDAKPYRHLLELTTQRMDVMLHKLVQVSELNRRAPEFQETALRLLVDEVLEEFADRLDDFSIIQEIPDSKSCYTDREFLKAAIHAIVENALVFTKEELDLPKRLSFRILEKGEALQISINDNGMGIEVAAIPHVEKMFYRGTKKSVGSGLGLYIADKTLIKLGGKIEIKSEPGDWTEVLLEIPAQETK